MKSREEVAEYINSGENIRSVESIGLNPNKNYGYSRWHYGVMELRDLLDFIYEGGPTNEKQFINKIGDL